MEMLHVNNMNILKVEPNDIRNIEVIETLKEGETILKK